MSAIASIIALLTAFFVAIPLLLKRFPAATPAEKEKEGEQSIVDEIKKGEETGRPGA